MIIIFLIGIALAQSEWGTEYENSKLNMLIVNSNVEVQVAGTDDERNPNDVHLEPTIDIEENGVIWNSIETEFKQYDQDNDGLLSLDEIVANFKAQPTSYAYQLFGVTDNDMSGFEPQNLEQQLLFALQMSDEIVQEQEQENEYIVGDSFQSKDESECQLEDAEIDKVDNMLKISDVYAYKVSCEKPIPNTPKQSVQKGLLEEQQQQQDEFTYVEDMINEQLRKADKLTQFLVARGLKVREKQLDENTTYLDVQPSILQGGELKSYQLQGLNWMISLYETGLNGILADEMGLGKTISTIAILGFLKQFKHISGPHLIVVPLTTMNNWVKEFKKWLPSFRVIKLIARVEERKEIFKLMQNGKFEVILVSYEGVRICEQQLKRFKYQYIIVDEAHKLKNDQSLFSQTLQKIQCRFKLLLTGTPLQNNPHELWALLNYILPQIFSNSDAFDAWFEWNNMNAKNNTNDKQTADRNLAIVAKVQQIIKPFMLRRTKNEVEKFLPPKKEIHLYVQLTQPQKALYRKILLKQEASDDRAYLNKLMQLRKVCLHLYMFPEYEDPTAPPIGEHLVENSGKLKVLDMFLQKLFKEKHKVIIFSQFTTMLNILEDYCNLRQYQFYRIDGSTTLEERDVQITKFQSPDDTHFLFLLSTRAGGLGITLTAADTVIMYDSDFNPQMDLQAMDRAHRIGQTKPVMVYRLVCRFTVEEKIIERQQVRLRWDALVIQNGGSGNTTLMSKIQNLKTLTSFGASEILKDEPYTEEDIETLLARGQQLTNQLNEELDKRFNIVKKDKDELSLGLKSINMLDFLKDGDNERDCQIVETHMEAEKIIEGLQRKSRQKPHFDKLSERIIIPAYQFVKNRDRLQYLKQREHDSQLFETLVEQGVDFTLDDSTEIQKLNAMESNELNKLSRSGFDWSNIEYNAFIYACEKYGRNDIDAIHKHIDSRSIEEIQKYIKVFSQRFDEVPDGDKILSKIKLTESRIEQSTQYSQCLTEYCKQFNDPRSEINIHLQSNIFNADNDRVLLYATNIGGYGNWSEVSQIVFRDQWTQFDEMMKCLTELQLRDRVNKLIRVIIKDNNQKSKQSEMQDAITEEQNEPIKITQQSQKKRSNKRKSRSQVKSIDKSKEQQQVKPDSQTSSQKRSKSQQQSNSKNKAKKSSQQIKVDSKSIDKLMKNQKSVKFV